MGVVAQAVADKSGNNVVVRRGKTKTTVRVARGLDVNEGDNVYMESVNGTYLVIARTDLTALAPRKEAEADEPDSKPKIVTGNTTIAPKQTGTYRNSKWLRDTTDLFQGSYSGSNNVGVAFYGEQVRQLKGATIQQATINATRIPGGAATPQTATLWLVTEKKRPSGAPTRTSSITGPNLAVGDTNPTFDIPESWITAMANNTAGGIAVYDADGSPFMRFAGMGTYSPAFTLEIDWRRLES